MAETATMAFACETAGVETYRMLSAAWCDQADTRHRRALSLPRALGARGARGQRSTSYAVQRFATIAVINLSYAFSPTAASNEPSLLNSLEGIRGVRIRQITRARVVVRGCLLLPGDSSVLEY